VIIGTAMLSSSTTIPITTSNSVSVNARAARDRPGRDPPARRRLPAGWVLQIIFGPVNPVRTGADQQKAVLLLGRPRDRRVPHVGVKVVGGDVLGPHARPRRPPLHRTPHC